MKYFIILIALCTLASTVNSQTTNETRSEEPILDFADVEPQFPGGPEAMNKFIQQNLKYPELSREMGEQGTVYVQFTVNTDGAISEIIVIRGVSQELDAEAIRVIKLMPKWAPGEHAGKKVRVRYTVPINFKIT